jgi:hypothetical protein
MSLAGQELLNQEEILRRGSHGWEFARPTLTCSAIDRMLLIAHRTRGQTLIIRNSSVEISLATYVTGQRFALVVGFCPTSVLGRIA